jgi:protocatechuate 3,4-dioxygenase beta subunit
VLLIKKISGTNRRETGWLATESNAAGTVRVGSMMSVCYPQRERQASIRIHHINFLWTA